MDMVSKCLDWRVLAGLAAIVMAVLVAAPGVALSVLPPLPLVAAYPLALLWLMKGMYDLPGLPQGRDGDAQPRPLPAVRRGE